MPVTQQQQMLMDQTAGMDATDSALAPASGSGGSSGGSSSGSGIPPGTFTAVGTAIMPGWGTAIGAVADMIFSDSGGGGGGGSAGSMTPSSATQKNAYGFDSSGWTVNIGGGSASATANKSSGIDLPKWGLIGLAAFGILAWLKKK